MDFKDYYKVLDIPQTATLEEIKKAFKKQAIKWHPDRNPECDTTAKMQEINEAYLILKDKEARERYDQEYQKYKEFVSYYSSNKQQDYREKPYYVFDDEILWKWIQNARRQAVDLAKQTIKDVAKLSITATKASGKKMLELIVAYSVFGIIMLILVRACSS